MYKNISPFILTITIFTTAKKVTVKWNINTPKNLIQETEINAIIVIKFSTLQHLRVSRINNGVGQVHANEIKVSNLTSIVQKP